MKLYAKDKQYDLYNGNMLDMLDVLEPNSIDAIVCDPPYELNFMGKGWDRSGIAFNKDAWGKCLTVLKPGGYLLAFGGSRTYHRIACAIEDAGFEIRDCIMWLYGCLSSDTEILTSNGWRNSETINKGDYIYSLDLQGNKLIKNQVKTIFKYAYDGEMVNLKNNNTDQLLTPNHHCIVKDQIKTRIKKNVNYNSYDYWYYKDAWQLRSQNFTLPLASNYDGSLEIGNLFAELLGWVISEGTYLKETNAITITQSNVNKEYIKRIRYILGKLHIKYSEYSRERNYKDKKYIEHDFYIGKESENVVNKIKELAPNKKLNWGLLELSLSNKNFLIKGLLQGDGAKSDNTLGFSAFYQKDEEELNVFQALLHLTNKQGWINHKKYYCNMHNNPKTELQGKHSKNRFVKYDGEYVWCVETEIGNFIARRNGKIFITGNSGFPKSQNLGLSVDKKLGQESKVVGFGKSGTSSRAFQSEETTTAGEYEIKEAQNEWKGWGTCLKPAYEPIVMARKPFKGSLVDNVLNNRVGGLNIDECRVGTDIVGGGTMQDLKYVGEEQKKLGNGNKMSFGQVNNAPRLECKEYEGRFPANVIHDGSEEVTRDMPYSKSTGGSGEASVKSANMFFTNAGQEKQSGNHLGGLGDEGSVSRYFYCAKASKKDRDDGLDLFENQKANDGRKKDIDNPFQRGKTPRKNYHPTVKNVELMQYLVRLVLPKGGTLLDPFMGSGSTGKACMFENRERDANYHFIGIELTDEYLPICKARIDYAINKYEYDEKKEEQETGQMHLDLEF